MHSLHRGLALLMGCASAMTAGAQGSQPDEAHPGPAPLDPCPAGPLVSRAITYSLMVFHIREPREDAARAYAELARKRAPDLAVSNSGPGTSASWPRVQAATVEIQPPARASIEAGSRQVDLADRERLRSCRTAFVVGYLARPVAWLPKLRRVQALVHGLAARTGGLIWDPQARELFTAASFADRRVGGWVGDRSLVSRHLSVRRPPAGERPRLTTRGMAAFGLPDVLAAGGPASSETQATSLLLAIADGLVQRPRIERTGKLAVRPSRSTDPDVRRTIAPGAAGAVRLKVRVGERATVDRNRLLEVVPDPRWESLLRPFHEAVTVR